MLGNYSNGASENAVVNVGENVTMTVEKLRSLDINSKVENDIKKMAAERETEMSDVLLFITSLYYENNFRLQDKSSPEVDKLLNKRKGETILNGLSSDLLQFVLMKKDLERNSDIQGLSIYGKFVITKTSTISGVPDSTSILVNMRKIMSDGGIKEIQELFNEHKMSFDVSKDGDILIYPKCIASKAQLAWDTIYKNEDLSKIENKKAEEVAFNYMANTAAKIDQIIGEESAVSEECDLPVEENNGFNDGCNLSAEEINEVNNGCDLSVEDD